MNSTVHDPEMRELTFVFSARRKLFFGVGSVDRVGIEARRLGGEKILLITDEGVEKAGLTDRAKKSLEGEELHLQIFCRVVSEPTIEGVKLAVEAVRKNNYDIVIGLGGGSSMDMSKIASIMATNTGEVERYIGANLVKQPGLPMVLIPTTAGTGSEATPHAVVSIGEVQKVMTDPHIIPDIAIVDPLMSVTMPSELTAYTGFDALSHAIESTMSLNSNPITNSLALEAVRLISNNLRKACYHSEDIKARHNMSLAATMAGLAFGNAGNVIGHSVAATLCPHHIPHGLGCALALPYVMEHNLPVCVDRFASIARAMGENVAGLTARKAALKAITAVEELTEDVGLPTCLRDVGIQRSSLPRLVKDFVTKYLRPNNPRIVTEKSAMSMYERMWKGK